MEHSGLLAAAVAAVAVAVVGLVAAVDPNEPGHYPPCLFRRLTGLHCPGCGSLRGIHALAHGDLLGAVGSNVLIVIALPVLAVLWLRWLHRCRTMPALALWAFAVLAVAFTVVRNLPFGAALAP